jgi:DNA-binding LacI/PurR family transcriptional regulator
MKATIRDVARAAGVSIGTVSRVLNGHTAVSEDSKSRVDKVVRSLNYSPLRKRRSSNGAESLHGHRMAVVLLGTDSFLVSSPIVSAMIHGLQAFLAEQGASVELLNLPALDEVPLALKQDHINGLILFGALQGNMIKVAMPALVARLRALPSVWLLRRPNDCWGDSVGPNDLLLGQLAAKYLLEKRHRRVAFLSPRKDHLSWRIRGLSFASHIERAGGTVRTYLGDDEASPTHFPIRSGHDSRTIDKLVDALLADKPRPSALFIPADSTAPFLYQALTKRGVEIGKELSLISCNHEHTLTEALHPTLTTLDIQAQLIGRLAAKQLAFRIHGSNTTQQSVEIGVEPRLIEGDSVMALS